MAGTGQSRAQEILSRVTPVLPISCSVGVVQWPLRTEHDEALDQADALMYEQKQLHHASSPQR
jgi:GGDEF domain-containing protein